MLRWDEYTAAAKELSPSALNLFMYLAKNQDEYSFYFSSKDYIESFDVTDRTYRNAKNELITKGYLKEDEHNHVYFDSSGAFKETKEILQNEIRRIGSVLKVENEELYRDFMEALVTADLKNINNEYIYKIEIKNLINLGKDYIAQSTNTQINNLI